MFNGKCYACSIFFFKSFVIAQGFIVLYKSLDSLLSKREEKKRANILFFNIQPNSVTVEFDFLIEFRTH